MGGAKTFRMKTRTVWILAAAVALVGVAVLILDDQGGPPARFIGLSLVAGSLGSAVNVTTSRRRHARRADDPHSVESQAATSAGSAAYVDTIMLAALLLLAVGRQTPA